MYSMMVWSKTVGATLSTSNQPWKLTSKSLDGGLKGGEVSEPL